jgi:hypothetical protein
VFYPYKCVDDFMCDTLAHVLLFPRKSLFFFNNVSLLVSDVPGLKAPAFNWPGLRRLGLGKIIGRAKSQRQGLAWPGFGLSPGFWVYIYIVTVKNDIYYITSLLVLSSYN